MKKCNGRNANGCPPPIRGPKGEKGEKGDKGETGDVINVGVQGPKGDPGEDGAPGADGPPGGTGPRGPAGAVVWSGPEERMTTIPDFVGQWGYDIVDRSKWIASGTLAGLWEPWTRYVPSVTLGAFGDTREDNSNTVIDKLVTGVQQFSLDAILHLGDANYYGDGFFSGAWAPFDSWITSGLLYGTLGNHDYDNNNNTWNLWYAKMVNNPGNRRYYKISLGEGLVDVFCLNSGYNNNSVIKEPDGIAVGSVQHAWFAKEIEESDAPFKVVFFHRPPLSMSASSTSFSSLLQWPELARASVVLCGHAHQSSVIQMSCGTPLVTLGNSSTQAHELSYDMSGGSVSDNLLWMNIENPAFGILKLTDGGSGVVEIREVETARLLYSLDLPGSGAPRFGTLDYEVIPPDAELTAATHPLGLCPHGMYLTRPRISISVPTLVDTIGSVTADGATLFTWTIPANETVATQFEYVGNYSVPEDSLLEVTVDSLEGYTLAYGLSVRLTGRIVT